jgi:phage shock protein A
MAEIKRLETKADALREQNLEAERKAIRLRKQARALYKKIRELGNRENLNILDLKREEKIKKTTKRAPVAPSDPLKLLSSSPTLGFPPSPAGFS